MDRILQDVRSFKNKEFQTSADLSRIDLSVNLSPIHSTTMPLNILPNLTMIGK
jgi:hypothetical protein